MIKAPNSKNSFVARMQQWECSFRTEKKVATKQDQHWKKAIDCTWSRVARHPVKCDFLLVTFLHVPCLSKEWNNAAKFVISNRFWTLNQIRHSSTSFKTNMMNCKMSITKQIYLFLQIGIVGNFYFLHVCFKVTSKFNFRTLYWYFSILYIRTMNQTCTY